MATEINRIARTESLFREVNERIAETADRFGADDAEFVCECADAGCGERLYAQLDEYEQVRADGVRFLVAPGHEEAEFERVLHRKPEYQVTPRPRIAASRTRLGNSIHARTSPRPAIRSTK